MMALSAQHRVFLAREPVDFRRAIDGLAALCRQQLSQNPMNGAVYVFRNRRATALKLLVYDGQGFWLCTKRLSQGRFQGWPRSAGDALSVSARTLQILLWNGDPERARLAEDWRQLA
jgi:transposase